MRLKARRYTSPNFLSGTNMGQLIGSCDDPYRTPEVLLDGTSNLLIFTQRESILGGRQLMC